MEGTHVKVKSLKYVGKITSFVISDPGEGTVVRMT